MKFEREKADKVERIRADKVTPIWEKTKGLSVGGKFLTGKKLENFLKKNKVDKNNYLWDIVKDSKK